jgi:hypothetical protein
VVVVVITPLYIINNAVLDENVGDVALVGVGPLSGNAVVANVINLGVADGDEARGGIDADAGALEAADDAAVDGIARALEIDTVGGSGVGGLGGVPWTGDDQVFQVDVVFARKIDPVSRAGGLFEDGLARAIGADDDGVGCGAGGVIFRVRTVVPEKV